MRSSTAATATAACGAAGEGERGQRGRGYLARLSWSGWMGERLIGYETNERKLVVRSCNYLEIQIGFGEVSNLGAGFFCKAKVGHSAILMWKEFWTSENAFANRSRICSNNCGRK